MRFMIGFTGAFVFIYSILFSMAWIYLILGLLINVNVIIFGEGTRIFPMKLLIQLFRWLPENSSLITTVASLISLSLMLTPLLPDKFNKVNVDTKLKVQRFLWKIIYLVLILILVFVLFNIKLENWGIITAIYGMLLLISPELILRLFSTKNNIDKLRISNKIKKILCLQKYI